MDSDSSDDISVQDIYIKIIEQPARSVRFRYECETKYPANIPGINSSKRKKTYPTIQVVGHRGKAVVVVSCVTKDPPHRPHCHNLVGRNCTLGVCTTSIPTDTMTVAFDNMGIRCVKKRHISESLKVRKQVRVDPFRTGFNGNYESIDINSVRLAFQVFLQDRRTGKYTITLSPVVSDPIFEKNSPIDLKIIKMSHCVSSVAGGTKDIIILCQKVAKKDIQVKFFEENGDWEAFADFRPSQVFKQLAIWFKSPSYKNTDVTEPVKVFVQLQRPSDGGTGEPLPFELLPFEEEVRLHDNKRRKQQSINQIIEQLNRYDPSGCLTRDIPPETSFLEQLVLPDVADVAVSPHYSIIQASPLIHERSSDVHWNIPLSEPNNLNDGPSGWQSVLSHDQDAVVLSDLMTSNLDRLSDFPKEDTAFKDLHSSFTVQDLVLSDSFTKLSIHDETNN